MRFPNRALPCTVVMRSCCIIILDVTLAASALRAQQVEPYPGLGAYVTRAMTTWKVPGVAIGIVRNDSVIYAKGYGVRSIKRRSALHRWKIREQLRRWGGTLPMKLVMQADGHGRAVLASQPEDSLKETAARTSSVM